MTALDDAPPAGRRDRRFQPGDSALLRHVVAKLEREKGFEPSTLCLGSRGSTARVAPPPNDLMLNFFSTLRLAIGGQTLAFAAAQSGLRQI